MGTFVDPTRSAMSKYLQPGPTSFARPQQRPLTMAEQLMMRAGRATAPITGPIAHALADPSVAAGLDATGVLSPLMAMRKAPAIVKPKWKPKESQVFDMPGLQDRWADVPQKPIPRHQAPRGVSPKLKPALGEENIQRLVELVERGIEQGGDAWYNVRPLRDEFIGKFGEAEGALRFNKFVDYVAATSPRANVKANIKRASQFQKLAGEGRDIGSIPNTGRGEGSMPIGYGHIAHNIHSDILGDIQSGKGLSGGKEFGRPKISSYAEDLKGNLIPVTVDTHAKRTVGAPYGLPDTVSAGDYAPIEQLMTKVGERTGLAPAQVQSSIWNADAATTGVADPRPFMELLDERVMATAKELNISPKKALDMFLEGKTALYGAAPIGLAGQLREKQNGQRQRVQRVP